MGRIYQVPGLTENSEANLSAVPTPSQGKNQTVTPSPSSPRREDNFRSGGVTAAERATTRLNKLQPDTHLGKLLNQHHAVAGRKSWPESPSAALKRLEGASGPNSWVPMPVGTQSTEVFWKRIGSSLGQMFPTTGTGNPPQPPRAGAAEVAPGVQIALQTSPQRPRSQPPPGGPSGKLERDSVCRRPLGGSGGGEGQAISHAPLRCAS